MIITDSKPLILVVDDDQGVATLQRRRLERGGFRVEVATNVEAAMASVARERAALVVMDYRLGGTTTGLELHRQMKSAGFDVPVIIVSGSLDDAAVLEALRSGIRDVVFKNTDYLDDLPDTVRGVLNQAAMAPELGLQDDRGVRALIVGSDPDEMTVERGSLERAGYEVEVVATADEALRAVRAGRISLALLDVDGEANMSALDLYDRLKAEGWKIPAILVTPTPDQAVTIRALRTGIRDVVAKSSDARDQLAPAIERVAAVVHVEHRLEEFELRMASIVGTTMDAILMCDEQLHIRLFNRSAEELFGCTASEALTQPLEMFVPDLSLTDAAATGHASPGNLRLRVEVDALRADRRVPVEVSVSDVVVYGKRFFTVIARDVSERRRIEAELREADRRKDEFLGMLAHELRNPLAAIMNASEVLHRRVQDSPAQKMTAVVRRQTRALARMVDDLLDVSRVTQGKIQLTDEPLVLSELVMRAADSARDAIARGDLILDVQIDPEPVWLRGDATRLEQVFSNLLSNATKFTPPKGRITLRAAREASEAVVRVRDSGIGMAPSLLPKIFDLFVQGDTSLDRSKSGLGIGLALVRQVVMLHGGQVTAFSGGLDKGSEFVVRLPASPPETYGTDEKDAIALVPASKQMRVVVVDDSRDLADCVALLVQTLGHEARAVYGGAEALTVSRSDPPDVMLVDIGMPGMTGYEVAQQVRSDPELADVHLVALTGYGRDEDRARVKKAGFDQHLTKPVTDTTLQALLLDLSPIQRKNSPIQRKKM